MSSEILQVFPQPVMIFNDMIKLTREEKDYLNKDQEMQDRIGVSGVQCTADYYLLNKKELLNVKNQIQNNLDVCIQEKENLERQIKSIATELCLKKEEMEHKIAQYQGVLNTTKKKKKT